MRATIAQDPGTNDRVAVVGALAISASVRQQFWARAAGMCNLARTLVVHGRRKSGFTVLDARARSEL